MSCEEPMPAKESDAGSFMELACNDSDKVGKPRSASAAVLPLKSESVALKGRSWPAEDGDGWCC